MTIENVKCPECSGEMVSRKGQYGVFWGCKDYPNCKGTRDNLGRSKADREEEKENEKIGLPSDRMRDNDRRRW